MSNAGQRLRAIREKLGYTIRDVEAASEVIAAKHKSDEYILFPSRLSDIETKGVLPSLYRLYSLAAIYRLDINEILEFYGISDVNARREQLPMLPPRTHTTTAITASSQVRIPITLDPQFNLSKTTNLGRMIHKWGSVPLSFLEEFSQDEFTYGYIGAHDFTMYPILLPGSFVRVDERKNKVAEGMWRSEYERPIYFIESREGFTCCWCSMRGSDIVLQPHPLSPSVPRTMRCPQEAEVIGQVVAFAMTLDYLPLPNGKTHSLLI